MSMIDLYNAESRFAECRGFRLHYRMMGSGEGPFMLLLHGSFLSMRSWRSVAGPLSEMGTVVVLDRPAFGNTSRPVPSRQNAVSYAPEAQSDMIDEFLGVLGIEKAILVGNSTGEHWPCLQPFAIRKGCRACVCGCHDLQRLCGERSALCDEAGSEGGKPSFCPVDAPADQ